MTSSLKSLSKRATRFGARSLASTVTRVRHATTGRDGMRLPPPARTLAWVRAHELAEGGIRVHSKHDNGYPEVSGYLVPTMTDYGERQLATRLVRWLMCIQRGNGSYTDADNGTPHIFDTGQVVRGLLAGAELAPGALEAARRACDYLLSEMVDGGAGGFGNRYSGVIPESVHLYVLPPLMQAAQVLNRPEYAAAAHRCLEYYLADSSTLQLSTLTHFLGFELEALIDLGRVDRARAVLDRLRKLQDEDGAIRGIEGARWVCLPGMVQLAVCWYKLGQLEPADRAMSWVEAHQQPSGGFLGSIGPGASYFPKDELSWAAKFYLDASRLRLLGYMTRMMDQLPDEVPTEDGRARKITGLLKPGDHVAEIGCGKGRFLKAVLRSVPQAHYTGVDICPPLLACLPADISAVHGSLERIPLPDDAFDVTFSVEAVEHSANLEAAVREMARVTRPGGWIAIIDKQQSHWGRLECPAWESWPESSSLQNLLNRHCDNVSCEPVSYDAHDADGLMLAWVGQKRSPLTGGDWHHVLLSPESGKELVERIRLNHISPWGEEIMLATAPGQRLLEVGSGTCEMSLALAQAGRVVTALDVSPDSLAFAERCAAELGVPIRTVCSDATQPLPFEDGEFECVWSSGLLDRVTPEQRRSMIREFSRTAREQVIVMVANASSLPYRAGMAIQQAGGNWPYGHETAIRSLRDDFEQAGLTVTAEFSLGSRHALNFLPEKHPIRTALAAWFAVTSEEELTDCNQGYLLVCKGCKR